MKMDGVEVMEKSRASPGAVDRRQTRAGFISATERGHMVT